MLVSRTVLSGVGFRARLCSSTALALAIAICGGDTVWAADGQTITSNTSISTTVVGTTTGTAGDDGLQFNASGLTLTNSSSITGGAGVNSTVIGTGGGAGGEGANVNA